MYVVLVHAVMNKYSRYHTYIHKYAHACMDRYMHAYIHSTDPSPPSPATGSYLPGSDTNSKNPSLAACASTSIFIKRLLRILAQRSREQISRATTRFRKLIFWRNSCELNFDIDPLMHLFTRRSAPPKRSRYLVLVWHRLRRRQARMYVCTYVRMYVCTYQNLCMAPYMILTFSQNL